jgi:nuclear pore complex protein Nup155
VIILGLLLDYMFQTDTTRGAREWPVDLLLDVGVPSETVLAVLENLQFNDGEGWSTAKRRVVAALSVYVSRKWYSDSVVGGGLPFGGEEGAGAVLEVLRSLQSMNLLSGRDGDALRDMIETIQGLA